MSVIPWDLAADKAGQLGYNCGLHSARCLPVLMICSNHPLPPDSKRLAPRAGSDDANPPGQSPYGRAFWLSCMANMLVTVAIALLFRYADFVTLLGGSELQLGWIVGVGMLGSLVIRLVLGAGIDRYGPRLVWLGALAVFIFACFAHLGIDNCNGPTIYLLRIAFCSSIAGIFVASITFVSAGVPTIRMAELIGMLGTAAFVGIILGSQLGDLLLGTATIQRTQVVSMFLAAGALGCCSLLFAWLATAGHTRPLKRRLPPLVALLRRYHPGPVLLVTVVGGAAIGLPGTFLRTYTAELHISRIALFFSVYAVVVIVMRLSTRRLPERLGLEPMILLGLAAMAVSQFLFLTVRTEWQLAIPGFGYGLAHAVLMPAAIAATIRTFPARYRGLGTSLVLGMHDLGLLIGAPLAGMIVHYSGLVGLPGYPVMFSTVALLLVLVGIYYAVACRNGTPPVPRTVRGQRSHPRPRRRRTTRPAAKIEQPSDEAV